MSKQPTPKQLATLDKAMDAACAQLFAMVADAGCDLKSTPCPELASYFEAFSALHVLVGLQKEGATTTQQTIIATICAYGLGLGLGDRPTHAQVIDALADRLGWARDHAAQPLALSERMVQGNQELDIYLANKGRKMKAELSAALSASLAETRRAKSARGR